MPAVGLCGALQQRGAMGPRGRPHDADRCGPDETSFPHERWVIGGNGGSMRRLHWISAAGVLALVGCMTQVDREAVSFPVMPNAPTYHRVDGRQLPPNQAIEALRTAASACQTQTSGGAAM